MYRPPHQLTPEILASCLSVARLAGRLEGATALSGDLRLRRTNAIRSLHSTLRIEGNSMSEAQVTALFDGRPVIGPPREIQEVRNAIAVYEASARLDYRQESDLLEAHGMLMHGLVDHPGAYRRGDVAVYDSPLPIHVAPPSTRVVGLMSDLFEYVGDERELGLIRACVFHYEFEFIHPFGDGNGRMGRLWQTLIASSELPALRYVPVEHIVLRHQDKYYAAIRDSTRAGASTPFLTYMLSAIEEALEEFLRQQPSVLDASGRLEAFRQNRRANGALALPFARRAYREYHKGISSATASRDLLAGVEAGQLSKSGAGPRSRYRFVV